TTGLVWVKLRSNDVIMVTQEQQERLHGWFAGRLPQEWQAVRPAEVAADREEITVVVSIPDVELAAESAASPESVASAARLAESRAGRAKAFREDTRERRMTI